MKRVISDKEFVKSMVKIEKEVAKIFGTTQPYVSANWNGDNKIEVIVAKEYEIRQQNV